MPTPDKMQDDPNVKMPAAVVAAAARSLELQNNLNPKPEQVTTDGNDADAEAEAQKVAPDVDPQSITNDPVNKAKQPEATSDDTDGQWEHKYNSLLGRYKELQKANNALETRVVGLEGVLSAMQAAPAPTNKPVAEQRFLTPEEENDYGKDMLDVVGRRAREVLAPEIEELKATIASQAETIRRLNGKSVVEDQSKLLAKLEEAVPNWAELNKNQDFLDWLALPDPFSGAIRQQLLEAAFTQGSAPRVIAFFKGFLNEEAATKPAPRGEPDRDKEVVARIPLAELAAPGRAKAAGAQPAPADKPYISRAQIATYYADVAAGRYKGRDELKLAHEQMIFDAQKDGRITD